MSFPDPLGHVGGPAGALSLWRTLAALLGGQFALVIWDTLENAPLAVRDRLGEKPLDYALARDGILIIASEIEALLQSGPILPRVGLPFVDGGWILLTPGLSLERHKDCLL